MKVNENLKRSRREKNRKGKFNTLKNTLYI